MNNKKIKNKESKVVKTSFDNFNYSLVPSPLNGFKEVRVMFTYKGKPTTRHLFIAENGNKNNEYYIAEAKKRIEEEIASGTLVKQSKHYYKPKKVSTGGKVAIAFLAVAAVGCGTFLTYKHLNPNFTVSFDTNGGSSIEAQSVQKGYLAKEPEEAPTKLGYTFDCWVNEKGKTFNFEKTPINKNTTIYASWKENNVTVTFHYENETEEVKEVPVLKGHTIEASQIPDVSDAYVGHTFAGWADDDGYDFDFDKQILADTDIYAYWDPIVLSVSFDANGGSISPESESLIEVDYNETIYSYDCPTAIRPGYDDVSEWYTDPVAGDKFIFGETKVTENMILYAHWGEIHKHDVTFNGNGGYFDGVKTETSTTVSTEYGQVPEAPIPTRDADAQYTYVFDGWDSELTPVEGDGEEYTAQWTQITNKYHVAFDANGGTITSSKLSIDVPYGEKISVEDRPTVVRPGYDPAVVKWYDTPAATGGNEFIFGTTEVVGNITLYARWGTIKSYDVTFKGGGGYFIDGESTATSITVSTVHGQIPVPPTPYRDATQRCTFVFSGWDKALTPVTTEGVEYTAEWTEVVNKYHVTFDANGGTIVSGGDPVDIPYGEKINEAPTVSRPGYDPAVVKWYDTPAATGGNEFIFGTTEVTDHMTLYARWGTIKSYDVTFNGNGGYFDGVKTKITTTVSTVHGQVPEAPIPTRDADAQYTYVFKGWDRALTPVTTEGVEYTAQWTPNPVPATYTLTYHFDNPTASEQTYVETYAEEEETVKPKWVPSYEGHTFAGWYTAAGTEGTEFGFGDPLEEDTEIYAHWTDAPVASSPLTYVSSDTSIVLVLNGGATCESGSTTFVNFSDPANRTFTIGIDSHPDSGNVTITVNGELSGTYAGSTTGVVTLPDAATIPVIQSVLITVH